MPIWRKGEEQAGVLEEAGKLAQELGDYRVWVDRRDGHTPGYRFNDWEMRGVPLRLPSRPGTLTRSKAPTLVGEVLA